MPQQIDLGAPYGVVAFPDEFTPEQILSEYDSLEAKRSRDINKLKLSNARIADINAAQQESHIPENIALGVESGIAAAPIAAGHVLRSIAESPWVRGATQSQIDAMVHGQPTPEREVPEIQSGGGGFPVNFGLNFPTLHYIGKQLVDYGVKRQKAAQEEAEQLGGGVSGNIARNLAETATVSSETLPFAALGMGPVSIAAGLQQYGLQKEQFKQQLQDRNPDLSDDEAYRIAEGPAALTGAITGTLTRVFGGTERLVNKIVEGKLKVEGVRALLREANLAGATELPEEYLDQLAQGFVEKAYINPEKPVSEIFNEAGMAGLTGYALGVGHGTAIQSPLHVAARVEEAVRPGLEESRLRRESAKQSRERISNVIAQREREQNAKEIGSVPIAPGKEAGAGEEAAGGVRVRNVTQNRVEAQPGEEVANATTPTTQAPPVAAGDTGGQTPPAPVAAPERKVAVFAGYQFGMADRPTYQIPGARPGILRNVDADGARAAGYEVPVTIPTFEQWQATQAAPRAPVVAAPPTPAQQVVGQAINDIFVAPEGSQEAQATPAAVPIPSARLQQIAAEVTSKWQSAPQVIVVDTADQLPASVQQRAATHGLDRVAAVADAGKVYLVSRNITDEGRARRLLLHEAVGHIGVESLFGTPEKFSAFMQGVAQAHAKTDLGAEIRASYGEDPVTVGKEIVARLAENPTLDPTLWQRIVAAIRTWARRMFKVNVSDNDIRVLLQRGRQAVQAKANTGTIGRTTYFLESGGGVLRAKNATVVGPAMFAITALHGTKHKVAPRFSTEKIGTGEGSQAYGWGLYFAELKEVAETYQRIGGSNGELYVDGVPLGVATATNPMLQAVSFVKGAGGDLERAILRASTDQFGQGITRFNEGDALVLSILKSWRGHKIELRPNGNMYTVRLSVEPDEMLDWDKQFDEQSDYIKAAIETVKADLIRSGTFHQTLLPRTEGRVLYHGIKEMMQSHAVSWNDLETALESSGHTPSPALDEFVSFQDESKYQSNGSVWRALHNEYDLDEMRALFREISEFAPDIAKRIFFGESKQNSKAAASAYLSSLGIKGIKFLDRGSRGVGDVIIDGTPRYANPNRFNHNTYDGEASVMAKAWLDGGQTKEGAVAWIKANMPSDAIQSSGTRSVEWSNFSRALETLIEDKHTFTVPEKTYNYVVFDDKDITITHENGQPVPVQDAMGGPSFALNPAPPPIEGLQVAGAAAQVGRVAEGIYRSREAGGQQLEGLAYQRKQFNTARAELKRMADIAYGRFGASTQTEEPIVFPDHTEGVGIEDGRVTMSDAFVNTLNAAGVPHDVDNVKSMQAEIFFEGAAKRLNNLQEQIQTLMTARQYYTELGVAPSEIEKIDKTLEKLDAQEGTLSGAIHGTETVGGRASEMRANENLRPQRMAQKDSLSLRPVADFFGRQVGGYRNFLERAQAAGQLAAALRDAATDPAEIARLTTEAARWLTLPDDVRAAIRTGLPLTEEQRGTAFAHLAIAFDDFDTARARMNEIVAERLPELNKEERELFLKMGQFKVTSGMQEVMVADVLAALDGESGGTGTLQSQAVTQTLRERISAIQSFALAIGTNLETNSALFQWLANPTTDIALPIGAAYNVDQQTLAMILDEVQRNPAFGASVVTLIEASNKKLANLPVVQLEQIKALVDAGDVAGARALSNRIMQRAEARASVAEAGLRDTLRKLDDLNIERLALDHGVAMFNELAATPEFTRLRDAVSNSPFGLVEPMVAQNNTDTTFKPFGVKGIPLHTGLVLGADDNWILKSEWFHRVDQWHLAAQLHLDAYDAALALYNADPVANPQPSVLGYDLPKIRGLRDATRRFVPGSFLELSLLSENQRWKVPRLAREMSKTVWFRQHDVVSKMVGGITGTDLRGRLADFTNHFLIARSIIQKYSDIPHLLHAAMKSHPSMQMNMANYRVVWNELAHWGRMFGSPVRIGFVLPATNAVVTAEDLALLKKQGAFEEELRRRVTETNPTAGIRLKVGGREVVRSAASVGDYGLPRHLNRSADSFIADVLAAYAGDPAPSFDPATDLSSTSTNPVVAFWNNNVDLMVQHVLDVRRGDRSMSLTPAMQAVELAAETQWRSLGVPALHSVEDLVNELLRNSPPMPGVNIRDTIIKGLNSELRQYADHAKRIASERAERDQARNSGVVIAFSADNEFTRPAAKLDLPSGLYDYGALTPSEQMTITSRANHERVVAYATAVHRAVSELQGRLDRYRAGEITEAQAASSYGGDLDEMKQVLGILRAIGADFEAAYRTGNPTLTQSRWYREGFGLFTSGVLALPTVGLRNMTQGQFETYIMSRAMGLAGQRLTMWRALKAMVRTVGRFATDVGLSALRHTDIGATFLTGKNITLFGKLADQISSLILSPTYLAGSQRVHELGYDTRDALLSRLKRVWEETAETTTREELDAVTIKGRKVSGLAAVPVKALRAFLDKMGVQQYDQAINATLLTYATWLQKRMEEVAITYGTERARQGLTAFSSVDPRWLLQPDEFGAFKSEQQNKDALGLFRLFLEGSANPEGFQLERNMWEFYQEHQAGRHPHLFTPRQFDAVQRRLLAEFNASTPANRASASAGNNVIRNLLTLQGYVSDGLLKLVQLVAGGSRDRTYLAATLGKLPTIALLSVMAVLIGYFAGGLTGEWEKRIRGRIQTLSTPLDRDFWTSWKRWAEGTIRLSSAQLFYIGDLILAMRGEVQGNRGFDPVGRVFPISIVQRFLAAVRGVWNTTKGSSSVKDAVQPMADFGRSMFPYWLEAERLFGLSQGVVKQGERIIRGESQVQGLLSDSRQSSGGPSYGPTTIIRRNLGDAVSAYYQAQKANNAKDAEAALVDARAQMQKLEDFYTAKYLKAGNSEADARTKAQRDVWNDYQEINPAVAGMMGKRPTAAQWELIRNGITGERGAVVDAAVEAWQAGAIALFGRQGNITREDVAGAGGGGGGRVSTASRAVGVDGRPIGTGAARALGAIGGIRTVGLALPSGTRRRGAGTSRLRRRSVTGVIRGTTRRRLGPRIARSTVRRGRTLGLRRRRGYAVV